MLDTTLATEFVPGTNLKGKAAGASWSFLLPRLDLGRIICCGAPAPATLATLARLGREVALVGVGRPPAGAPAHVYAAEAAALPAESADLALLADARATGSPARLAELTRLLRPDGLLYVELRRPDERPLGAAGGLGPAQLFALTPRGGEVHTAVPLHDQQTLDYFRRHALFSPAIRLRGLDRVERFLSRRGLLDPLTRRYGALLGRGAARPDERPPRYLRELAGAAGHEIDRYGWGLSAPGEFSSRKVLFFLIDRASGAADMIVKMTRDPALNPRLENERRALDQLWAHGLGTPETLPRVLFAGHHGGLAIVGETIVAGAPFRQRTRATVDCPYARSAIDWLVALGAASADRAAAGPEQVAEGLATLFKRFTRIYQLDPGHYEFLRRQIAAIGASRAPFPLVFQHGDPGTWNILVSPGGRAAFLDWEAAEPQGMPLWDLFYFLRAYGVWSSRQHGVRDSLASFQQQYLADSPLGRLLVATAARASAACCLAPELVEPLFYTCWMHRALKEATRLAGERLERGHYVSLLRLCIDQRAAPGLRRLFALESDA